MLAQNAGLKFSLPVLRASLQYTGTSGNIRTSRVRGKSWKLGLIGSVSQMQLKNLLCSP